MKRLAFFMLLIVLAFSGRPCLAQDSGPKNDVQAIRALYQRFIDTDALRKVNGKWLIVEEHVSVPVDLEAGKADLMSKP